MPQTVLITGTGRPYALGFNLVKRYLEHGDRVFASIRRPSEALETLKKVQTAFSLLDDWRDEQILGVMVGLAEAEGAKNAKIMWPVRIALAGKAVTPGGAVEIARILGKEEALRRIQTGIEKLEEALGQR